MKKILHFIEGESRIPALTACIEGFEVSGCEYYHNGDLYSTYWMELTDEYTLKDDCDPVTFDVIPDQMFRKIIVHRIYPNGGTNDMDYWFNLNQYVLNKSSFDDVDAYDYAMKIL